MSTFTSEDDILRNDTVTTRIMHTPDADGEGVGEHIVHQIPVQYIEEFTFTYRGRSWCTLKWESNDEIIASFSLGTGTIKYNSKNFVKAPTESGKDRVVLFIRTVAARDIATVHVTSKI